MVVKLEIGKRDGTTEIEQKLSDLESALRPRREYDLIARLSGDRRATFFKDIWASAAVATGIDHSRCATLIAWGLQDWPKLDTTDSFVFSHPALLAMQRGANIHADNQSQSPMDVRAVKRFIIAKGGVLGSDGGRHRTVIELDPDSPRAAVLWQGRDQRDTFFGFIREALKALEIADPPVDVANTRHAKNAILEWLFELYNNGYEYARRENSVRILRLQKHLYPTRGDALRHSKQIPELSDYLNSQPEKLSGGNFNLVEASISDYGPGIVGGFLSTFAGATYRDMPHRELLEKLLHDQLSSKTSDPSAGLGIGQAIAAARQLDAFLSLRTAEFSLYMRGKIDDAAKLTFRKGEFTPVVGTHWQLLLPNRGSPR
jgi:hypothetical protein